MFQPAGIGVPCCPKFLVFSHTLGNAWSTYLPVGWAEGRKQGLCFAQQSKLGCCCRGKQKGKAYLGCSAIEHSIISNNCAQPRIPEHQDKQAGRRRRTRKHKAHPPWPPDTLLSSAACCCCCGGACPSLILFLSAATA